MSKYDLSEAPTAKKRSKEWSFIVFCNIFSETVASQMIPHKHLMEIFHWNWVFEPRTLLIGKRGYKIYRVDATKTENCDWKSTFKSIVEIFHGKIFQNELQKVQTFTYSKTNYNCWATCWRENCFKQLQNWIFFPKVRKTFG